MVHLLWFYLVIPQGLGTGMRIAMLQPICYCRIGSSLNYHMFWVAGICCHIKRQGSVALQLLCWHTFQPAINFSSIGGKGLLPKMRYLEELLWRIIWKKKAHELDKMQDLLWGVGWGWGCNSKGPKPDLLITNSEMLLLAKDGNPGLGGPISWSQTPKCTCSMDHQRSI